MPQQVTVATQGVIKAINIAVSNVTPTLLTAALVGTAVLPNSSNDRKNITVYNNGPNTIYIGDSTVTTTTGLPIPAGSQLSADYGGRSALYAIAATAAQVSPADTRVLEAY